MQGKLLDDRHVAIIENKSAHYPKSPPFSPSQRYPEYPFSHISSQTNHVYPMVRDLFFTLGLDRQAYGTPAWNPLGKIIKSGQVVLLKPNLVRHANGYGHDVNSVITNGSVIRAVLDFVHIALQGKGTVIIGDAPIQSADFTLLKKIAGLEEIHDFYRKNAGRDIEILDFRKERAIVDSGFYALGKGTLPGDPRGYFAVNLGKDSHLLTVSKEWKRFRVTNYDPEEMGKHHNLKKHEYLISGSVLASDVVINLPKMKTHRKVCVTASLKNLVGINGHKDWLPHHRSGSVEEGGDEYLGKNAAKTLQVKIKEREDVAGNLLLKKALRYFRRSAIMLAYLTADDFYFEGSWYGNDTCWRMAADLNVILFYANKQGKLQPEVQRNYISIVDGIVAGEGEGPLEPTPRNCGILLGGENPVAVDSVVAGLMGFDKSKIPLIANLKGATCFPLMPFSDHEIKVRSNVSHPAPNLRFCPPKGWQGHVELP